ncbi:MAG: hypothetical protein ACLQGJ_12175 [Candidatus Dormibacteria bacterium]
MIARFMPDALFSSDPTTAQNASLFLSGLGVDVPSMQQNMRDPSMLASVAQQWMAASGPDTTQSTNQLQSYADKYGYSALPTSYQAIVRPDPLQTIRNGLLNIPILGLLNNVPLLSGGYHAAVNLLTGNLDLAHIMDDPRADEEQTIKTEMKQVDNLSSTDIQNMTPLLNQIADDSGFMGFMNGWDHARNSFLLEIGSTLFTGVTKGKWQNPFDPTSAANLWAQAHADNMASALFGDGWAQANPTLAGMMNFVINTADDPTSYLGLLGKLSFVQLGMNEATAAKILDAPEKPMFGIPSKTAGALKGQPVGPMLGLRNVMGLIKDPSARAAWGNLSAEGIRSQLAQGWLNTARAAYASKKLSTIDIAQGFDIPHVGSTSVGKWQLVQQILAEPDPQKAFDLYMNGNAETKGFGPYVMSGRGIYNTHAHWTAVAKAASSGKLNRMRTIGGIPEVGAFNLITDPVKAGMQFKDLALVAGMSPAEYGEAIDKFMEAATGGSKRIGEAVDAAKDLQDAILKAYTENTGVSIDTLDEVKNNRVKASTFSRTVTPTKDTTLHAPDPALGKGEENAGKEMSTTIRSGGSPQQRVMAQQALDDLNGRLALAKSDPDTPKEMISYLNDEIKKVSKPTPMLTTQLADLYAFPYTPYEMVVAKSKVLRSSEKVQATLHADAVMSLWKRWTIGRISSAFRITLGDDTIRPVVQLMANGSPITGLRLLGGSILRSAGIIDPLGKIEGKVGRALGASGDYKGLRASIMARTEKILSTAETKRLMQDYSQYLNEYMPHAFQPYFPDDVGYATALHHVITNLLIPDPLVKAWMKGREALPEMVSGVGGDLDETAKLANSRRALEDFVRSSDDPKVKEWLNAQGGDTDEAHLQAVLNRWHSFATGMFKNAAIRKMVHTGSADIKDVAALVKREGNMIGSGLPTISARTLNAYSKMVLKGDLVKFPDLVFSEITKPMIVSARANGLMAVKGMYEDSLRNYYKGTIDEQSGAAFEKMVDQESTSQAVNWMLNNTYQGSRSVVGGALRNVMPFYGATANLDRFIWRQMMNHPYVGVAAVRAMNASEEAQVNTTAPAMSGGSGFMAMLGFGGGEGLTFNPLNAFFLTADGLGSVIPGTGPVFSPMWSAISGINPGMAQLLSTIPGISNEIDWSTGQASPMFPWLSDLLQGGAMAAFGTGNVVTNTLENIPGIGEGADKINELISAKVQQWDRDKRGSGPGGTVTQADQQAIARDVGLDLATQGAAQFVAPVSPEVKDVAGENINTAMSNYNAATTDVQKDALITQALGVSEQEWQAAITQAPGAKTVAQLVAKAPDQAGAMMAYQDSRVSEDQRDEIQAVAPWVVSSSAGKYQYTSSQTVTSLSQWDLMRNMGNVETLQPFGDQNSFVAKVTEERQVNDAWLQYDQLKNLEYATMQQNGWSTSSPQYTIWNETYMQPALVQMEQQYPAWAQKFAQGGGGTSAADLSSTTAPLRTLQTWEVIPQHSDYETATTVLWRNAIAAQQQAASMIYELQQTGGSTTETQMIMTQLNTTLQNLASQDPTFAEQLSGYTFGKWEDVVNLEADEQLANFYTAASQ